MAERRYQIGPSWSSCCSVFGILIAVAILGIPVFLGTKIYESLRQDLNAPMSVLVTVPLCVLIVGGIWGVIYLTRRIFTDKEPQSEEEDN